MALKSEATIMKVLLIVLGVLLLGGLMFGGKFVSVRNELAVQNEAIAGAWAQVDVALQRRVGARWRVVRHVYTDRSGRYRFGSLRPGVYRVVWRGDPGPVVRL